MLKYTFLTEQFYNDYRDCSEIEKKTNRPHVQLKLVIDGVIWCIPMRSRISHPNAYITDSENRCGVDFSKAVAITDEEKYLDAERKPRIRQNEFEALRGKEYIIQQRFRKYISTYRNAKNRMDISRNRRLVSMSTLQYFEEYI